MKAWLRTLLPGVLVSIACFMAYRLWNGPLAAQGAAAASSAGQTMVVDGGAIYILRGNELSIYGLDVDRAALVGDVLRGGLANVNAIERQVNDAEIVLIRRVDLSQVKTKKPKSREEDTKK